MRQWVLLSLFDSVPVLCSFCFAALPLRQILLLCSHMVDCKANEKPDAMFKHPFHVMIRSFASLSDRLCQYEIVGIAAIKRIL